MSAFAPRALRAAAAPVMAFCVVSCSTPDTRTEPEQAADRALVNQVMFALLKDRYLDADHIDVDANRGVVRLSGKVGTDSDLRGALRIAAAVPGVRRVDDELEIMDFGRLGHHR